MKNRVPDTDPEKYTSDMLKFKVLYPPEECSFIVASSVGYAITPYFAHPATVDLNQATILSQLLYSLVSSRSLKLCSPFPLNT